MAKQTKHLYLTIPPSLSPMLEATTSGVKCVLAIEGDKGKAKSISARGTIRHNEQCGAAIKNGIPGAITKDAITVGSNSKSGSKQNASPSSFYPSTLAEKNNSKSGHKQNGNFPCNPLSASKPSAKVSARKAVYIESDRKWGQERDRKWSQESVCHNCSETRTAQSRYPCECRERKNIIKAPLQQNNFMNMPDAGRKNNIPEKGGFVQEPSLQQASVNASKSHSTYISSEPGDIFHKEAHQNTLKVSAKHKDSITCKSESRNIPFEFRGTHNTHIRTNKSSSASQTCTQDTAHDELLELTDLTLQRMDKLSSKDNCDQRTLDVNENTSLLSNAITPCGLISPKEGNKYFITSPLAKDIPWLPVPYSQLKGKTQTEPRKSESLKLNHCTKQNRINTKTNSKSTKLNCQNTKLKADKCDTNVLDISHKKPSDCVKKHPVSNKEHIINSTPSQTQKADTKALTEQRQKHCRVKRKKRASRTTRSRDKLDQKSRDSARGYTNEVFDWRAVGDELIYGDKFDYRVAERGKRLIKDQRWLKTKPRCEGKCDICDDEISDGDGCDDDDDDDISPQEDTKLFLFTDLIKSLLHCRFLQYR